MITKRNQPITGASPEYGQGRNPLLPDAANTSRDAENNIRKAPMPFSDRMSTAYLPAPTSASSRSANDFAKDAMRYGGKGTPTSVRNKPSVNYGAVGYSKPYASKRGLNPQNDGFPLTGVERKVGPGSFPKAIKSRSGKMRTNLDIFGDRELHEAGLTRL